MDLKFYRCNTCGNIVVMIDDSGNALTCCGKQMTLLRPGMTDGSLEKHIPVYKCYENLVHIKVGETLHPMEIGHHIEFVVIRTNKGFHFRRLCLTTDESTLPEACFCLCKGERILEIYEYCNIHGLFKCSATC